MFKSFNFRKLFQYFLQGLLVTAPLAITVFAIYWIVTSIDELIPIFTTVEDGRVKVRNFGLGFLIIIASICIIGYLSTFFIQSRIFNLFDHWLEKAPASNSFIPPLKISLKLLQAKRKNSIAPCLLILMTMMCGVLVF